MVKNIDEIIVGGNREKKGGPKNKLLEVVREDIRARGVDENMVRDRNRKDTSSLKPLRVTDTGICLGPHGLDLYFKVSYCSKL